MNNDIRSKQGLFSGLRGKGIDLDKVSRALRNSCPDIVVIGIAGNNAYIKDRFTR